jgi:glycogen debranching enzyme
MSRLFAIALNAIATSFLLLGSAPRFTAEAQSSMAKLPVPAMHPVTAQGESLSIRRDVVCTRPFSVVGPRGALLGDQDGSFELWLFPWKVLSKMRISAAMQDYDVPIEVNNHAASIEVRPEATIITFSHANFTVKEVLVAPKDVADYAGAMAFFEIESVRPMTLTFSFTPEMKKMWPAPSDDMPSPEWVKTAPSSGYYMLHLNFPDNAAGLAMPTAEPGIMEPYQERAASYPLQFVLRFDPKKDEGKVYPLLAVTSTSKATSTKEIIGQRLAELDNASSAIYTRNQEYYANLVKTRMHIETPDERLNQAFSWAEVSIDQLRVITSPDHSEEALTAGFVGSGDSVRPGFGWFFGRDALWTIFALNGTGGFETTRQEIEFLLKRQSPDGKIPHEWSQTASVVDWKSLPYEYASADATTLLPMAMDDYLQVTGDESFIEAHWENLARAWKFETTHDADKDGIYDNSEGSAWVESWVPSMPQQEIYLALLDEEASVAFAHLAAKTGHADLAAEAQSRAEKIRGTIEREYYEPRSQLYAFSWNSGTQDTTSTIFPSVAWWDGSTTLAHPDKMISKWESAEFSTDWGTRPVSDHTSFYDPISYHQGSVWPLFTGWVSVAEYRMHHGLSAYEHLMQNVDMTWEQDLGNVTELLSGEFNQPLGRSTAHQLWSAAMVISPVVRGMFGLEWNEMQGTLSVTPTLPVEWESAKLDSIPFGNGRLDLTLERDGTDLVIRAVGRPAGLKLESKSAGAHEDGSTLRIPLPKVEVSTVHQVAEVGAETRQLKVLDQEASLHSATLTVQGIGGMTYPMVLRENAPGVTVRADGANLGPAVNGVRPVSIVFPPGGGYSTKTVTFSW